MIKDWLEVQVQLENVLLKGPKVLLERLVKWDLLEAHGEKGDKGDTGGIGQQGPIGPRGSTCPRGMLGAKRLRGVAVFDLENQ